jgi:hypothetical protein
LRGNLGQIPVEGHSVSHEVLVEPMPPLSKAFYDPIANILDNVCSQSQFSFTPNDFKNCYDMDMIRQSATGVCSVEASFQNPLEKLHPYQPLHEDENNIDTMQEHVTHLVESKNQGISHFYLDHIVIYMEKFFTVQPQSIYGITFVLQDYQGLCYKDQSCF